MRIIVLAISFVLSLLASDASGSDRRGNSLEHVERLRNLEIRRPSAAASLSADRAPVRIGFDALGRHFDLNLEANTSLMSPDALARLGDDLEVFRGSIEGEPGSWVRIVLSGGRPTGMLFDGAELLAIEADDQTTIFRLADVRVPPGTMTCAVGSGPATGQQMYEDLVAELRPAIGFAAGAVEEIEIGMVADALFAEGRPDAVQSILTRMNNVDGIFSSELGIQITVPDTPTVFDDTNDPFSATTEPDTLLDELTTFRANSPVQRQYGLTHLFTGRTLDGSTVGIAFIGVLCNAQFGVGITETGSDGPTNEAIDSLIAAHEIGHNFGASHDGEVGGSCPLAPANDFIMATRVNGNPEFSDCSKAVMLEEAAVAACIQPLPATDMRITSFQQPETVLLGAPLGLTFAADNRGSSPISDVVVDITIPGNVTLLSASPSQGNCTNGAGLVSCNLGTVAGSSGATIVLSSDTVSVGDASFSATVTATGDEFAGNNDDLHRVTVEPAVNLVVDVPAPANVNIGERVVVNLGIENSAGLDATGVAIAMSIGPGLTAASASWTAGDCSVAANSVVCTAPTFGSGARSTLALELDGTSSGNRAYSVEASANESDADESNNSVEGRVTVIDPNAATSSGDDDGGGSMGALLLVLAAGMVLRRRRLAAA